MQRRNNLIDEVFVLQNKKKFLESKIKTIKPNKRQETEALELHLTAIDIKLRLLASNKRA